MNMLKRKIIQQKVLYGQVTTHFLRKETSIYNSSESLSSRLLFRVTATRAVAGRAPMTTFHYSDYSVYSHSDSINSKINNVMRNIPTIHCAVLHWPCSL